MTVVVLTYKMSNVVHKVFKSKKDAEKYVEFCVKREAEYHESFNRYVDEGGDCPEYEGPASLSFNMIEYEVERFKAL